MRSALLQVVLSLDRIGQRQAGPGCWDGSPSGSLGVLHHVNWKIVTFSDLLKIKADGYNRIPLDALRALALPVPEPVLEQLCSDHGRDPELQCQYAALDLRLLRWSLESKSASELVAATVFGGFRQWATSVERRVDLFSLSGWACIDVRPGVVAHWEKQRTWLTAPVFVDAVALGREPGLHLMEGHTRLGVLRGLSKQGIISAHSRHSAWIGTIHATCVP